MLTPPPKKNGFHALIMSDDFGERDRREKSGDKRDKPRNTGAIVEALARMRSSMAVESEEADPKRAADVDSLVNHFGVYSQVTFYSQLPFAWLHSSIAAADAADALPPTTRELMDLPLSLDSLCAKVGRKLKDLLAYYHFSLAITSATSQQEKSSLIQTYWSLWSLFAQDSSRYFYLKNSSYFVNFNQDMKHLRAVLEKNYPAALQTLASLREADGQKSVEKTARLPDHAHYALISVLKANVTFVKRLEAYGSLQSPVPGIAVIGLQRDTDTELLRLPGYFQNRVAEDEKASPYAHFLVYGRNTICVFNFLLNMILEDEVFFEVFAPYPFQNSSVRYSQVRPADPDDAQQLAAGELRPARQVRPRAAESELPAGEDQQAPARDPALQPLRAAAREKPQDLPARPAGRLLRIRSQGSRR